MLYIGASAYTKRGSGFLLGNPDPLAITYGADDEIRTRDPRLGKPILYR